MQLLRHTLIVVLLFLALSPVVSGAFNYNKPVIDDGNGLSRGGLPIYIESSGFKLYPISDGVYNDTYNYYRYIAGFAGFLEPILYVDGTPYSAPFGATNISTQIDYTVDYIVMRKDYLINVSGEDVHVYMNMTQYMHLPFAHVEVKARTQVSHNLGLVLKLTGYTWPGPGYEAPHDFLVYNGTGWTYVRDPSGVGVHELYAFKLVNASTAAGVNGTLEMGVIVWGTNFTLTRTTGDVYMELPVVYGVEYAVNVTFININYNIDLNETSTVIDQIYTIGDRKLNPGWHMNTTTYWYGDPSIPLSLDFSGNTFIDPSGVTYDLAIGRIAGYSLVEPEPVLIPETVTLTSEELRILFYIANLTISQYNWTSHSYNFSTSHGGIREFYDLWTDIGLLYLLYHNSTPSTLRNDITRIVLDNVMWIINNSRVVNGFIDYNPEYLTDAGYPYNNLQTTAFLLYATLLLNQLTNTTLINQTALNEILNTTTAYSDNWIPIIGVYSSGMMTSGEAYTTSITTLSIIYYTAQNTTIKQNALLYYNIYNTMFRKLINNSTLAVYQGWIQYNSTIQWYYVGYLELAIAQPNTWNTLRTFILQKPLEWLLINPLYASLIGILWTKTIPAGGAVAYYYNGTYNTTTFDDIGVFTIPYAIISLETLQNSPHTGAGQFYTLYGLEGILYGAYFTTYTRNPTSLTIPSTGITIQTWNGNTSTLTGGGVLFIRSHVGGILIEEPSQKHPIILLGASIAILATILLIVKHTKHRIT